MLKTHMFDGTSTTWKPWPSWSIRCSCRLMITLRTKAGALEIVHEGAYQPVQTSTRQPQKTIRINERLVGNQ